MAVVHSWVSATSAQLDLPLHDAVARWLASDWPFTHFLPRAITGSCRVPSASNSSSAPASVRMLRETNGILCLPRNSLVRRQLVQPGCQYTLMGSAGASAIGWRFLTIGLASLLRLRVV